MPASVGLYLNPRSSGPDNDVQVIHEVCQQIELADRLGFSVVWPSEHAFDGQSAYSDPIPLAAYLAGRVHMKIGFAVAVLPLHNLVRFCTQVAELDALSQGRLILGIGTGLGSKEYQGYGFDWNARVPATVEAIDVIKQIWAATDGFEYHGEHFDITFKGRVLPSLVQKPYPPMVQATGRADVLYRLGRDGDGALVGAHSPQFLQQRLFGPLVQGMTDAGLDPAAQSAVLDRSGILHQIFVLEDGQDPDILDPYNELFKSTFGPNQFRFDAYGPKKNFGKQESSNLPPGVIKAFSNDDTDDFVRHQFTIGTADEVVERLAPQITEGGAHHLMMWATWGLMPHELVMGSIQRFGERVLPRLAALQPAHVSPVPTPPVPDAIPAPG